MALVALALAGRAWAYDDMTYNFTLVAPDPIPGGPQGREVKWLVLNDAQVPGLFRIGWLSNEGKNSRGASINAFVMLLDKPYTARQLLDANVKDVTSDHEFTPQGGKGRVVVSRKGKFRVLRQEVFKSGGHEGFVLEVVAPGTGAAIPPDTSQLPKGAVVPTRQKWVSVVRGEQVITLLFTCPDAAASRYANAFSQVERSFKVH